MFGQVEQRACTILTCLTYIVVRSAVSDKLMYPETSTARQTQEQRRVCTECGV